MLTRFMILLLTSAMVQPAAYGQAPGRTATPDERLDHLLGTWHGRSHEDLRKVWGRQSATRTRGANEVYLYEHRIRVRANPLTGQVHVYQDGLVCTALFEVDINGTIVRTARQGGGRDCWRAFRKRTPP